MGYLPLVELFPNVVSLPRTPITAMAAISLNHRTLTVTGALQ